MGLKKMRPTHYVAVFGGAVAGSEAAFQLSQKGIRVAVFEQNALPYGKIEAGLPKWHHKLRDRQEKIIDEKLNNDLVKYVPLTCLGKDIALQDILQNWGFSAVLLATGAWKDRALPVKGVSDYLNKGLLTQNQLVSWFNNNHDPDYNGADIVIPDESLILGGGLASIDVIKLVLIETVRAALQERNVEMDALTLERKGVVKALDEVGLSMEKLGLKGPRLVIRRSIEDMALTPLPENPTDDDRQKAKQTRHKLVKILQDKFPFEVLENRSAIDKIVEDGRLTGLVFRKTASAQMTAADTAGREERIKAPLIISAIGSIPQPIPGISMDGEIYRIQDMKSGKLDGFENVFALGNAVTGRGNIRQSQIHSRQVSENVVDDYLVWEDRDYSEIFLSAESTADERVDSVVDELQCLMPLNGEQLSAIEEKILKAQQNAGYDGNYEKWISKHLPKRLEDMTKE